MSTIHQIKVVCFHLTKSELHIAYDFKEQPMLLNLVPEYAAELLKNAGYIDDYDVQDGTLCVKEEASNMFWLEWDWFVMSFEFSQLVALNLANYHETHKEIEGFKKYFDIPALVEDFKAINN